MRVRATVLGLLTCWLLGTIVATAQENAAAPRLLLTPKLLRRLKRDRERQTVRWQNFERRIESVPDSPERGFELALYFAVTQDAARGKEAAQWAVAHPCETRQVALVFDWVGPAFPAEDREQVKHAACSKTGGDGLPGTRDSLFRLVSEGGDPNAEVSRAWPSLKQAIEAGVLLDAPRLYALCEFLIAFRGATGNDLRSDDPHAFALLPKEFLLSLKPGQVEHPDWHTHAAALALIALGPNLENSQFLQGWAIEDGQTLRDGPGVAYEFLWADPYLPGIAYQNMDPWIYEPSGRLFARKDWTPQACWLAIEPGNKPNQENCAAESTGSQPGSRTIFGTLTLVSLSAPCLAISQQPNNRATILWHLKPNAPLVYHYGDEHSNSRADPAGMWQVPNDAGGKICAAR